ncbi:MAG TPA: tryptophan synthase subunit alpha [Phycisphaerae bacterium]|nr:tryptophan synthase subunit alpha [Phycisphaerae bacterium]
MAALDKNRLVIAFGEIRSGNRHSLLPFITAGYPDLATTDALLHDFERRGVRICELGIPFSDPIADGPVIQASYTEALAAGVTSEKVFEMVRRYRGAGGALALSAMVSYSIVYRHGVEAYLSEAAAAGFDATIVPDLPLEETPEYEKLAAAHGLCNVMLIAPTTDPDRRLAIARHSRGFIYYVSVAGITGERDRLPEDTIDAVAELRKHTDTPICVGFGISRPETVAEVCKVADGAIVGSAIVHRIADAHKAGTPQDKLVKQIGDFVQELLEPVT